MVGKQCSVGCILLCSRKQVDVVNVSFLKANGFCRFGRRGFDMFSPAQLFGLREKLAEGES